MSEDPRPHALVRLLWDAYDEVERVAEAMPPPGRGGAIGRLNSGGWIVAHLASQQDRYWNVAAQGLEPDAWLTEQQVGTGEEPSTPVFGEALEAFQRVRARAIPYQRSLRGEDLASTIGRRRPSTVEALLARSAAHLLVHTGEMAAIASLVGAGDLGLPGRLTHSTAPPATG